MGVNMFSSMTICRKMSSDDSGGVLHFPYEPPVGWKVGAEVRIVLPFSELSVAITWCVNNCQDNWRRVMGTSIYEFENPEDAAHFKLVWC